MANGFSLARLLKVLLPVIILGYAGFHLLSSSYEQAAQAELQENVLQKLLADVEVKSDASIEFKDADGDLVADAPEPEACIDPDKLVFSYIANAESGETDREVWKDVMDALSEATGKEVEFISYTTTADQLSAMATDKLHITGLNTGSVATAVKTSGFVPVCTFGREDGEFGYQMLLLAPAGGEVKKPADVAGHKIIFTRPDSNSGFKAALVYLMTQHNLLPERDYEWGFSFDHADSIRRAAGKEFDVVPVASDIFNRMVSAGEVSEETLQTIYESETFPPAALGYAHNLKPELREKIAQTLLDFDWAGTSVEARYSGSGSTQFVPVSYKDDWANIRRLEQAVQEAQAK